MNGIKIHPIKDKKELQSLLDTILTTNLYFANLSKEHWNGIAKPLYSLGKLEEFIIKIASIQENTYPKINKKAILVMCADNGIVKEGVSQVGQEVTGIVSRNIAKGIASVNKMADYTNTKVIAIDIGIAQKNPIPQLLPYKIAYGTRNFLYDDAMTKKEMFSAITVGIEMVRQCKESNIHLIGTGEMGIGNTTTSTAIASVLLNIPAKEITGRGAGLTDIGLQRKIEVISKGIQKRKPDTKDPLDILAKLGGLDIAGLVGIFIGGGIYKIPIVIDGVISAVSALLAYRLCPRLREYMLPSHISKEIVARKVFAELDISPCIDANLCLGEGTGCTLLFAMLEMAMRVYQDNIRFQDIQVEQYRDYKENGGL